MPAGSSPKSAPCRSRTTASCGVQPNLPDSGQSDPSPLVSIRISTSDPGAAAATFATSPSLSVNKSAHARVPSNCDVGCPLDGVGIEQILRTGPRRANMPAPHTWAGDIRSATSSNQRLQEGRMRVCLDGVMNTA
jgi:hypothetical protein